MQWVNTIKVGYVLKRYPRYSETFIVSEILAHEAIGLDVQIFALHHPLDSHFQDVISQVRAPVKYLLAHELRGSTFWNSVSEASDIIPDLWKKLKYAKGEDGHHVYKALQLACEVRRQNITHLHAHFATSATIVARLASFFADVPYSFTTHAKDIFHESVNPEAYQLKLQNAAAVITVSDYNLNYLQQMYGTAANKVQRIYNGLNLSCFPFTSPQHRSPRILAVGRLVEKKGFSVLIDACKVLQEQGRALTCQIVGAGELEANLRHQIAELGLQDTVTLMGPRPQGELVALMQSAAVFVAPCVVAADRNRDGLPTVLLEAMALGTPCISTDVTGIPEVLRHQKTGLMVPQHDPIALAQAIEQLLTDSSLRVRLAIEARALIEQNFEIHQNTAQLRTMFQSTQSASFHLASEKLSYQEVN
jgi:colanic acid/amylovoran biosynthesis glycosyltransferase